MKISAMRVIFRGMNEFLSILSAVVVQFGCKSVLEIYA
jgi:hypothetical protein